MAIQNRRGDYADFNPDKMLPGEIAVVLSGDPNADSGRSVYICFQPGVVKRFVTYQDFEDEIQNATEEIQEQFSEEIRTAIRNAVAATNAANAAQKAANDAAEAANKAAEAAGAYVLGDISDKTVTFTEAEEEADIASGDTTETLFGKILKKFHVIANLIGTGTLATTVKNLIGAINELNSKKADSENGILKFLLGDESVTAELRRGGSSGTYSLSLITKNGDKTSYYTVVNPDGTCNFVMRAGKSTQIGSTTKPVYVNAAGNVVECAGGVVLGIQSVNGTTSGTVEPGKTGTITINFNAVSGASKYVAIPKTSSFGSGISNLSISGTKLTVTMFSVYETHTLTAAFDIIALA